MRRIVKFRAALAALIGLAACSGHDAPTLLAPGGISGYMASLVASVTIVGTGSDSIPLGTTRAYTAYAQNATGQTFKEAIFTWSVGNTAVATVDTTGVVTSVAPGKTTLSVQAGSAIATRTITILALPQLNKVNVTLSAPSIVVNGTTQGTATMVDSSGKVVTGQTFTWTSANNAVATVSASGLVTAVAVGTTTVTSTSGTITGTATVTVTAPPQPHKINVTLSASSVVVNGTTQGTATMVDSTGKVVSGQTFAWTSANNAVAAVSASGLVTAVAVGTTTVSSASGSAVKGTATVTVTAAPPPLPPAPPASGETFASMPQTFINSAAPAAPAAGGQVISVSTVAAFQNALNTAKYGDVIALANGVTFNGNFVLPNKGPDAANTWITIRPANLTGMPAEGARMTPTIAAAVKLPVLLSTNPASPISTAAGAHHYRLIGLEITQANSASGGLVRFGDDGSNGQTTLASVPHDLALDRSYVHGVNGQNTRRCVGLNSASTAIVDSYLSACHELGADAQAIASWNGPGPFKIVNNYLEASGENVMFGGADPGIANLVPSDIEVRHNHFYKPVAWKGVYTIKNLFESKNSMRMLVEGNLFENNWTDAQTGTAINIKASNQGGMCPWCTTQDLTFRYNIVRNAGSGFALLGTDPGVTVHTKRVTIVNNLVYNINVAPFLGDGRGMMISEDPTDFTIAHNTIMNPDNSAVTFGGGAAPPVRLSIRDNVMGGGAYGVKGSGLSSGTGSITPFMSLSRFVDNVILLSSAVGFPTGNYYPSALAAIGFVNMAAGDFHLLSSSPYRGKATDGTDPGADVDGVLNATLNVIVP